MATPPTSPTSPTEKKRRFRLTFNKAEAGPTSPKLVSGHTRTQSEGSRAVVRPKDLPMSPEAGPIQSASADNLTLVGKTPKSPGRDQLSPLPVSPDLFRRDARMDFRSPKSPTKSPRINVTSNSTGLTASPLSAASNSSNSSATSRSTFSPTGSNTADIEERALQAADSFFWLVENSPKEGYLRASDIPSLCRNLSPTLKKGQTKEELEQARSHHSDRASVWVDLASDSDTGRLLLKFFHVVATSSAGTHYHSVQTDETAQGRVSSRLTEEAERLISEVEAAFEQDQLSHPLQLALQRCDDLLVDWLQKSNVHIDHPPSKPSFAQLDTARHNMLGGALVMYGLTNLKPVNSDSERTKCLNALAATVMGRLMKAHRMEVLLQESEKRMSPTRQALVQRGRSWQAIEQGTHAQHTRYLKLKAGLEAQSASPEHCCATWCWLNRVENVLKIPEFLHPYFEQTALSSNKLVSSAAGLKNIEPGALKLWAAGAIRAAVTANAPETDSDAVLAQILKMQETLESLKEDELRRHMQGFE